MKIDLINEKAYSDKNIKIVKKLIIDCFIAKTEWYRKPLINTVVKNLGLSEEIVKDKSYNSIFTKCKSLIGSVITSMINDGHLYLNDKKLLVLLKDIKVIVQEDDVKNYIGSLLKKQPLSKKEINSLCIKYYKADKTETKEDDNELKQIISQILKSSVNDNILKLENNMYSFVSSNTGLDCKIQNVINESKIEEILPSLRKAISIKGGEFFEALSVKVVSEYFKYTKNTIIEAKVTGGSEDNGIDGIIEFTDTLRKNTRILMQAKVRTNNQVTLKEVREFYGAFKSQKADVGIFITNASYHREAIKFSKTMNDLVLIDGEILLELCMLTNTGIIKNEDNTTVLDEKIFVYENFN